MVDDRDPHEVAGLRQPAREPDIVGTWRRVAGRVIVEQHHRRRGMLGRGAEHLARMHETRIERAERDHDGANHSMFRVEQQHAEALFPMPAVTGQEVGAHGGRRSELRARLARGAEGAATEFERRQQPGRARRSHARRAHQRLRRRAPESADVTGGLEYGRGDAEHVAGAHAAAEQHRDQLVVAER